MKLTKTVGEHIFGMEIGPDPLDPPPRPGLRHEDLARLLVVKFSIDGSPVRREDFDLALRLQSIESALA